MPLARPLPSRGQLRADPPGTPSESPWPLGDQCGIPTSQRTTRVASPCAKMAHVWGVVPDFFRGAVGQRDDITTPLD